MNNLYPTTTLLSVSDLLRNIDQNNSKYKIKYRLSDLQLLDQKEQLVAYITYRELDMPYVKFLKLKPTHRNKTLMKVLKNSTYHLKALFMSKLNLNGHGRRHPVYYRFSDSMMIVIRNHDTKDASKNKLNVIYPALNLNVNITHKSVKLTDDMFTLIEKIIELQVESERMFYSKWSEFKETLNMSVFGVSLTESLNKDISVLLEQKYPEIKHEYIEHDATGDSNLTFDRDGHRLYRCPVSDDIKYGLAIKVTFPVSHQGSAYQEMSDIKTIAKYIYFANEVNGSK